VAPYRRGDLDRSGAPNARRAQENSAVEVTAVVQLHGITSEIVIGIGGSNLTVTVPILN